MGPFRPAGPRRKVEAAFASFQWPGEPNRFKTLERCFFKTFFRHDKHHLCSSSEDWVLSLQNNVCRLASEPKRAKVSIQPALRFSNEDKVGTIQLHDNALVITLRIGGYDVKRVMVDQGNSAEIIYLDLYNGLNLRPEDLTTYDSPLMSFDGKVVIPRGQIRLPV